MCACQALDFRRPLKSTPVIEAVHAMVRTEIPHTKNDRIFADDIRTVLGMIRTGAVLEEGRRFDDGEIQNLKSKYDQLFEVY